MAIMTERSLPPTAQLRPEQVAALFQNVVPGVVAAAIAAIVLAGALIRLGALNEKAGTIWAFFIFACAVAHITLRYLYVRRKPDSSDWKGWANWFVAIAL